MAPSKTNRKSVKKSSISKKTSKKSQPKEPNPVKGGRKCTDCKRTYETSFLYARHVLMVHQKSINCPMEECGRKLKSIAGLLNHFRGTHKNACSLCGHSTKNRNGLRVHLALVHDLKRCVCSVTRRERMNAFSE